MQTHNLTCIGCPMGCALKVELQKDGAVHVTGNICKRGETYARREVTHPTRIVTSTVRVTGGSINMVSVKTEHDIPKEKIMDIMQCIKNIQVKAPISAGDIIIENAADTGVSIIATKDIPLK